MFRPCPKINYRNCGFAAYSKWDPITSKKSDKSYLFCGIASGRDTRVQALPKCWKKMTKYEQSKFNKETYWGYK